MVTKKMTRQEALALWEILKALGSRKFSIKFSYAIAKTAGKLEDEVKAISRAAQDIPDKVKNFEDARQELAKSYARRDESGNPMRTVSSNGNRVWDIDPGDIEEFQSDLNALKEDMAEEWKAVEDRQKDLEDMLDEEIEVKFHRVQERFWPDEIEPAYLQALEPMFVETGEELEGKPTA